MKNSPEKLSFWKNTFLFGLFIFFVLFASEALATPIFINEIHYNNIGGDIGEAVEIAGPAGSDLSGWRIAFYNGSNGRRYNSYINISSAIPNQSNGFGTLSFLKSNLQNSTEGVALLDDTDAVIQFLSYEGAFIANNGPVSGSSRRNSTDIGVFESESTPVGYSLQLIGTGTSYDDFSWATPDSDSFGDINAGQHFTPVPTPEPGSFALMGLGLAGMFFFFRYRGLDVNGRV